MGTGIPGWGCEPIGVDILGCLPDYRSSKVKTAIGSRIRQELAEKMYGIQLQPCFGIDSRGSVCLYVIGSLMLSSSLASRSQWQCEGVD